MNYWDIFTVITILAGCFFFLAGTLGLLRFPDVFSRLHALTKADNLGLGLIVLGIMPQLGSVYSVLQVLVTWVLVMCAGAVSSYLIANYSLSHHPETSSNEENDHFMHEGKSHEH